MWEVKIRKNKEPVIMESVLMRGGLCLASNEMGRSKRNRREKVNRKGGTDACLMFLRENLLCRKAGVMSL